MDPKGQNKNENIEAAKNSTVGSVKQEKLEKAHGQSSREGKIKKMTPKELRKKLSNRNQNYAFRLEEFLAENQNYTVDQAEPAINQVLPEIVVAQREGIPAPNLYQKAPREKAIEIASPKREAPKSKFWMHAVDGGLLCFTTFAGFFGLTQLFSQNPKQSGVQQQLGTFTMIVVTVLLGILVACYSGLTARGREYHPSIWKMILIGAILVVIMMVVANLTALPAFRVIDPVLNPRVHIVLTVIAFFSRRWFRQEYHTVDPPQIKRENGVAARRRSRRS